MDTLYEENRERVHEHWDDYGGVCGRRRYVSVGSDHGGHRGGGGKSGGEYGRDGVDCDCDFSAR